MIPVSEEHEAQHLKKKSKWPHFIVGIAFFNLASLAYYLAYETFDIEQSININTDEGALFAGFLAGGLPIILGFIPGYCLSKYLWPFCDQIKANIYRKSLKCMYLLFFIALGVTVTTIKNQVVENRFLAEDTKQEQPYLDNFTQKPSLKIKQDSATDNISEKPFNNINETFMGFSVLCIVANKGDIEALNWAIKNGADVNQKCGPLQIPSVHIAAEKGFYDIVLTLLRNGADPLLQNHHGRTSLYYAGKNTKPNKASIVELIESYIPFIGPEYEPPLDKNNVKPANLEDWLGEWEYRKSTIIIKEELGQISVQGATVGPPRPNGSAIGSFDFVVDSEKLRKNTVSMADDWCTVDMQLKNNVMIVEDNLRCGGLNANFHGVYSKK